MCYTIDMSKKKTKKKISKPKVRNTWDGGNNPVGLNLVSPMSYEAYIKAALEIMSGRFQIRTYKLATGEDYPGFIRGKDLRIQVWFDKKYTGYELIIEVPFWLQSNRNKEDRLYMRQAANVHLKTIHEQVEQAKKKFNKSSPKTTKKKTTKKKRTVKIGTTQKAFENAKKSK